MMLSVMCLISCVLVQTTSGLTTPMTTTPRSSDIQVTASTNNIHAGFTKFLTIKCNFLHHRNSVVSVVMSVILSKTATLNDKQYLEIATITAATPDTVNVKNSLGAKVTGQLKLLGDSNIVYEWTYPNQTVTGKYQCISHGLDRMGHPVMSSADTIIDEQSANLQMILDKLQIMEHNQDLLLGNVIQQNLTTQTSNCTDLKHPIDFFLSHTFSANTSYGGHTYLLSNPFSLNIYMYERICELSGGYLVEINDKKEYDAISSFLTTFHITSNHVYIGMTDEGHEGQWTYIHSGGDVTYFRWGSTPVENVLANCVFLHYRNHQMYNEYCVNKATFRFLCEIPS